MHGLNQLHLDDTMALLALIWLLNSPALLAATDHGDDTATQSSNQWVHLRCREATMLNTRYQREGFHGIARTVKWPKRCSA